MPCKHVRCVRTVRSEVHGARLWQADGRRALALASALLRRPTPNSTAPIVSYWTDLLVPVTPKSIAAMTKDCAARLDEDQR